MPATGESAPTFTATVGPSDHDPFALDDPLGDSPVVPVSYASLGHQEARR